MGVPGLWDELEPGVKITSWSQLVEPAFGREHVRGLRVGVDVALWLFHSRTVVSQLDPETGLPMNLGPNADLRVLFYRALNFLADGVLACFVFDGPQKPKWKRDKFVRGMYSKTPQRDLQAMFDTLGMEWRVAPGEAEAELAAMQQRGEIDAVLTDDVDTLLFGGPSLVVIRNPSKTLSANTSKKAQARRTASQASQSPPLSTPDSPADAEYLPVPAGHNNALVVYSNADIISKSGLGREELVLVALLSGADYDTKGSKRFGLTIAIALAKAGYAKTLFEGIRRIQDSPATAAFPASSQGALQRFFTEWRAEIANELRTNENRLFSRREKKLADDFEASTSFPDMTILSLYLDPTVSDPQAPGYVVPTWSRQLDMSRIAQFSSRMFEWGNAELRAKFRRTLWMGLAHRQIRQSVLSDDAELDLHLSARLLPCGYLKLVTERKCEASTDFVPAWRVELDPDVFNPFVDAGLPASDPYSFPDIDEMSDWERERFIADRKRAGKPSKLPAPPSGVTEYRHWIPCDILESCRDGYEVVDAYMKLVERKKKEKAEEEKRKKERQLARSSPDKKKATSRSPRKARQLPDPTTSDGHSSDLDRQWSRIEDERAQKAREEMLAQARKGKGKAKATSLTTRVPESPISSGSTNSRLRGSSGHSYASTSGATLFGMGFGTSTKVRSLSPLNKFSTAAPFPTPPATGELATPSSRHTQRRIHLYSSSDDSETPRAGEHIAKANRTAVAATTPNKLARRRKPSATPVEILSSDDSSDNSFEGNLEDFLAARRRKQLDSAAPKKAARPPSRPHRAPTEVLVLSD
ncbi:hypothetical protein JCM3774_006036 [Rhodotorula dairenensis]